MHAENNIHAAGIMSAANYQRQTWQALQVENSPTRGSPTTLHTNCEQPYITSTSGPGDSQLRKLQDLARGSHIVPATSRKVQVAQCGFPSRGHPESHIPQKTICCTGATVMMTLSGNRVIFREFPHFSCQLKQIRKSLKHIKARRKKAIAVI